MTPDSWQVRRCLLKWNIESSTIGIRVVWSWHSRAQNSCYRRRHRLWAYYGVGLQRHPTDNAPCRR